MKMTRIRPKPRRINIGIFRYRIKAMPKMIKRGTPKPPGRITMDFDETRWDLIPPMRPRSSGGSREKNQSYKSIFKGGCVPELLHQGPDLLLEYGLAAAHGVEMLKHHRDIVSALCTFATKWKGMR